MHIASNPPREEWIQTGFIIIHDLYEVMPTMRSLACSLSWLVACVISLFSVLLLQRCCMGKKEACFLMAEKSGTSW